MNNKKRTWQPYHPIEHMIFVLMALILGLSAINQQPFTMQPLPSWVGYILMGCVAFLVTKDIIDIVKQFRKKNDKSNS